MYDFPLSWINFNYVYVFILIIFGSFIIFYFQQLSVVREFFLVKMLYGLFHRKKNCFQLTYVLNTKISHCILSRIYISKGQLDSLPYPPWILCLVIY